MTFADLLPGQVLALCHDITSETDWQNGLSEAKQLGRLNVRIYNAGLMLDSAFESVPVEELRLQYMIKIEGPFIGLQGDIPLMKAAVAVHGALPSETVRQSRQPP